MRRGAKGEGGRCGGEDENKGCSEKGEGEGRLRGGVGKTVKSRKRFEEEGMSEINSSSRFDASL